MQDRAAAAYECAKRADDPDVKLEYLREALESAQSDVALLTYIQARFDNGIFERYKSLSTPVFEARDAASPAWRGAVIHPGGDYAWMVYVGIHDHFHSEVQRAFRAMEQSGTLGPSSIDLEILELQRQIDGQRDFDRAAIRATVPALKEASVSREPVHFSVGQMDVEIRVETIPFEDWDVANAHKEMDLVSFRIGGWQPHQQYLQHYLRSVLGYMRVPEDMVEALYGQRFVVHVAVSRADLISFLDAPDEDQLVAARTVPEPELLHYSSQESLVEAYVTGRAVRAICGKWWVPVGDEYTHIHLPVCAECERLEPVAQSLKAFARRIRETPDRD